MTPEQGVAVLELARRRHRADSSSSSPRHQRGGIEKLSSCRLTVVLRRAGSPAEGRVVRVLCKTKSCQHCGPVYRDRKVRHFSALVAGLQLHELTVTAAEWSRLRKRLSGRADYVRVPVEGGFLVLTTAAVGEAVADPVESISIAFTAMVVDGRNVTSSRAWAEPVEEQDEESWERVAVTVAPVAEVARAFADCGLLRERVRSTRTRMEGWAVDLSHGIPQALAEALDLRPPPRRSSRLPIAA